MVPWKADAWQVQIPKAFTVEVPFIFQGTPVLLLNAATPFKAIRQRVLGICSPSSVQIAFCEHQNECVHVD